MDNKESSIYSSIIQTKTASLIPVLKNGKTIESKYNPENEAQRNIELFKLSSNFIIITGISSGVLINSLIQKNPCCKIIAIENSPSDLAFLSQLPLIKKLSETKNCIFCTKYNLFKTLTENYIPSFFGNFQIFEQKAWTLENPVYAAEIRNVITQALENIKSDYSVQCYFGKIWMNNIFNNLSLYENVINHSSNKYNFIDRNKTAAIIAAGPSFDSSIKTLKENAGKYYIIATDTTYSSLLKNHITPDCVISVDGQNVSFNHFLHKNIDSKTLFVFDLSSSYNAAKYVLSKTDNLIFSISRHPLHQLIKSIQKDAFIELYSGSGTVTIAAFDFALKSGFSNIEVFGADFSYSKGKAYTKGTYLDSLYLFSSNRLNTYENNFDRLLYRTPLLPAEKKNFTTQVLSSYKKSFEDYISYSNCNFSYKDYIYNVKNPNASSFNTFISDKIFNTEKLFKILKENIDFTCKNDLFSLSITDISLLPLISWLRKHDNNNSSFSQLNKTAYIILERFFKK